MEFSKPGFIKYQGRAIQEFTSVEKDEASNDMPVKTNLLGMAGHSDGAEEVSLTINSAIPRRGTTVNWAGLARSHTTITLDFVIGGVTTTTEGRVMTVKDASSPDRPNAKDIGFHGRVIAESGA